MNEFQANRGALFVLVLTALAPTLAAQTVHPKLLSKEKTIRSFVVLPPRIEVLSSSEEVDAAQRSSWANTLSDSLEEAIKEAGWEVKVLSEGTLTGKPELATVEALQKEWDALLPNVRAKPKDIAKAGFTLGTDVQKLGPAAPADALVFIRATMTSKSKTTGGRTATGFEFHFTYKYDVRSTYALVDAQTGEVLYFFPAEGKGDGDRTEEALKGAVSVAIRKLPR